MTMKMVEEISARFINLMVFRPAWTAWDISTLGEVGDCNMTYKHRYRRKNKMCAYKVGGIPETHAIV